MNGDDAKIVLRVREACRQLLWRQLRLVQGQLHDLGHGHRRGCDSRRARPAIALGREGAFIDLVDKVPVQKPLNYCATAEFKRKRPDDDLSALSRVSIKTPR